MPRGGRRGTVADMSRSPSDPYASASNPYMSAGGRPAGAPPEYEEAAYATPPRTSVLAVLSFLCSIPCCFIPGAGLLGVLFGALGVSFIASSRGRLSGRGLAVAGIILGIISTTLWVFACVGGMQAYTFWNKQMQPAASGVVVAAAESRPDEARKFMSPGAAAEVDDARLADFGQAIVAAHGQVVGASGDFWMLVKSFQRTVGNSGGGGMGSSGGGGAPSFVPFAFETSAGPTLGWAVFDSAALQSQSAQVEDLFVYIDSTSGVTLRKDGPAVGLAASMGLRVVEPPGASAQPVTTPPAPDKPAEPEAPASASPGP